MCTCWLCTDARAVLIWAAISNGFCPRHSEQTGLPKRSRVVEIRLPRHLFESQLRVMRDVNRKGKGKQLRNNSSPGLAISPLTPPVLTPLLSPRFTVKKMGVERAVYHEQCWGERETRVGHRISETFNRLASPKTMTKIPQGSKNFGLPWDGWPWGYWVSRTIALALLPFWKRPNSTQPRGTRASFSSDFHSLAATAPAGGHSPLNTLRTIFPITYLTVGPWAVI